MQYTMIQSGDAVVQTLLTAGIGGLVRGGIGAVSGLVDVLTSSAPEEAAEVSGDLVNLASPARTQHILFGDATGGGHMWPGAAGKSVFPSSWSGSEIMNAISDIATDPNLQWEQITGKAGAEFYKKRWPLFASQSPGCTVMCRSR